MTPAAVQSKLRGGYYTPVAIADFLARWAITRRNSAVLEPSAGDGAFVQAVGRHMRSARVDAVELFDEEATKIRSGARGTVNVSCGDVFAWYTADRDGAYDAVVGNPPFIRYQTFPEAHRGGGFALMHLEGLRPNRLTNAWVPFVVLATRALKPGGRLAMVLPAELLQVTYASELRAYLARSYRELTVVTFRRLVFDGIQQETVLLLGVRSQGGAPAAMSFLELESSEDLTPGTIRDVERVPVELDHAREKWTQYYLSRRELGLIRELERSDAMTTLGDLAHVDVGIVTGRNEFFVLTPSRAASLGLRELCLPLVGRSAQIPGLTFTADEWQELEEADGRCLLLQLGRTPREALSKSALAYVEEGEAAGYHEGYKCRIRQPAWWYVPSTDRPDGFMLRQIHDGPRIIANASDATSTDTIHRVRVKAGVAPGWLAAASMNSVTFAFSELRGRSYGGGVLELEPNEADGLPFPRPGSALPLADLDLWARRKEADQILDEVDRLVLSDCGLTAKEIILVRAVWRKLSRRRLDRKRR